MVKDYITWLLTLTALAVENSFYYLTGGADVLTFLMSKQSSSVVTSVGDMNVSRLQLISNLLRSQIVSAIKRTLNYRWKQRMLIFSFNEAVNYSAVNLFKEYHVALNKACLKIGLDVTRYRWWVGLSPAKSKELLTLAFTLIENKSSAPYDILPNTGIGDESMYHAVPIDAIVTGCYLLTLPAAKHSHTNGFSIEGVDVPLHIVHLFYPNILIYTYSVVGAASASVDDGQYARTANVQSEFTHIYNKQHTIGASAFYEVENILQTLLHENVGIIPEK